MKWAEEQAIARTEAARHESERQRKYELARQMRANGHSNEEIMERTGLKLSRLQDLFRGMGRRKTGLDYSRNGSRSERLDDLSVSVSVAAKDDL